MILNENREKIVHRNLKGRFHTVPKSGLQIKFLSGQNNSNKKELLLLQDLLVVLMT